MSADRVGYPVLVKANVGLFRHPDGQPLKLEGFEWPADSFTYRMIADGDLTTEKPANLPLSAAAPEMPAKSK